MRIFMISCMALLLIGCSTMPVSTGTFEDQVLSQQELLDQVLSQQELLDQAILEATRDSDSTAVVLAALAGLTSVFTTIGLSRRRRSSAALLSLTGSKEPPSLQPKAATPPVA